MAAGPAHHRRSRHFSLQLIGPGDGGPGPPLGDAWEGARGVPSVSGRGPGRSGNGACVVAEPKLRREMKRDLEGRAREAKEWAGTAHVRGAARGGAARPGEVAVTAEPSGCRPFGPGSGLGSAPSLLT